jgi:hypothetical protein
MNNSRSDVSKPRWREVNISQVDKAGFLTLAALFTCLREVR